MLPDANFPTISLARAMSASSIGLGVLGDENFLLRLLAPLVAKHADAY